MHYAEIPARRPAAMHFPYRATFQTSPTAETAVTLTKNALTINTRAITDTVSTTTCKFSGKMGTENNQDYFLITDGVVNRAAGPNTWYNRFTNYFLSMTHDTVPIVVGSTLALLTDEKMYYPRGCCKLTMGNVSDHERHSPEETVYERSFDMQIPVNIFGDIELRTATLANTLTVNYMEEWF